MAEGIFEAHIETLLKHMGIQDDPKSYSQLLSRDKEYEMSESLSMITKSNLLLKARNKDAFNRIYKTLKTKRMKALDKILSLVSNVLEDGALSMLLTGDEERMLNNDDYLGRMEMKFSNLNHETSYKKERISNTATNFSNDFEHFELEIDYCSNENKETFPSKSKRSEFLTLNFGTEVVFRGYQDFNLVIGIKNENIVTNLHSTDSFMILNGKDFKDLGPVQYGDEVLLRTVNGYYVSVGKSGELFCSTSEPSFEAKFTFVRGISSVESSFSGLKTARGITVKLCDNLLICYKGKSLLTSSKGFLTTANAVTKDSNSEPPIWTIMKATLPFIPEWTQYRVLRYSIAQNSEDENGNMNVFNLYPETVQEQLVVEDLLFTMIGIEGRWLKKAEDEDGIVTFHVPSVLKNQSIVCLVNRILPLCNRFCFVQAYIEKHSGFEYGRINHALCGCLSTFIKEYLLFVTQLEHQFYLGKLSLQKLTFYIRHSFETMEHMYLLTSAILNRTSSFDRVGIPSGGSLLNIILDLIAREGDSKIKLFYRHILSRTCVPYFEMLHQWLFDGVVQDPYEEFQIKVRVKTNVAKDFNELFWDKFEEKEENIPRFLEKFKKEIRQTGKYLNVVRECGKVVESRKVELMTYGEDSREYGGVIKKAYSFASKTLLDLLMNEKQLLERLRSIKRYFLLNQGDFFCHFMDIAEDDLKLKSDKISQSKLESLLELAVRSSSAGFDPFKDDLTCYLDKRSLLDQVTALHSNYNRKLDDSTRSRKSGELGGIESFTLHYEVKWPVSLIISQTLFKYKVLFRHLFHLKCVERMLGDIWMNHQTTKELNVKTYFQSFHALRQRMHHFVQNIAYYMMVQVLEPNWNTLESNLQKVETVEEVEKYHDNFLNHCMKGCLLATPSKDLLIILTRCLTTIKDFTVWIRKVQTEMMFSSDEAKEVSKNRFVKKKTIIEMRSKDFEEVLKNEDFIRGYDSYVKDFDENVRGFIMELGRKSNSQVEHNLGDLLSRLDYNGFYSKQHSIP